MVIHSSGLIAAGILGCIFSVVEHSNVPSTRLNPNLSVPLTLLIVRSVALFQKKLLTLLKAKCIPILLYATEVCPLLSREKNSFEFAITRLFMKIFETGSPIIVIECQRYFAFLPVIHKVTIRIAKFLRCFIASKNSVCSLFTDVATIYSIKLYILCSW
jgi:hypothetical protein